MATCSSTVVALSLRGTRPGISLYFSCLLQVGAFIHAFSPLSFKLDNVLAARPESIPASTGPVDAGMDSGRDDQ